MSIIDEEWLLDTPAGRLYAFFYSVRGLNPNTPLIQAVQKIWGIEGAVLQPVLHRRIAAVSDLPDEVEEQVRATVGEYLVAFALATKDQWEEALLPLSSPASPGSGVLRMQTALSDDAMSRLEFCGRQLHEHSPQPTIPSDTLTWIRSEVEGLLADLDECDDVDPRLRQFLVDRLREMQDAMAAVRLAGADALVNVADRLLGGAVARWSPEVQRAQSASDTSRVVFDRVWTLIDRIEAFASIGGNGLVIGAAAVKAIAVTTGHMPPS